MLHQLPLHPNTGEPQSGAVALLFGDDEEEEEQEEEEEEEG